MKKVHITIGIPAFNEEANIVHILKDVLKQKQTTYKIDSILVVSDGSMDRTVKLARGVKNKAITVIDNRSRKGAAGTQNEILQKSSSEILVILNADIMITDKNFIEKLIAPIIGGKADLTCSAIEEVKPNTFTENVIHMSMMLKNAIFHRYQGGDNIYTCHGTARAFSKRFYTSLRFPKSIGEDAYSYLLCKKNGYPYKFVKNTRLFYRAPNSYADHEKQALRFFISKQKMSDLFGEDVVAKEYHVPFFWLIIVSIWFMFRYPLHMAYYLGMSFFIRVKSIAKPTVNEKWEIAKSSKVLR